MVNYFIFTKLLLVVFLAFFYFSSAILIIKPFERQEPAIVAVFYYFSFFLFPSMQNLALSCSFKLHKSELHNVLVMCLSVYRWPDYAMSMPLLFPPSRDSTQYEFHAAEVYHVRFS